jgi:hypothetical protein
MFRDRQGFMQGMNMYVPAMQWAASLNSSEGSVVSLGRPLAAGAPLTINIPANASGYYVDPVTGGPLVLNDTPYGRNLVLAVTTALTGSTSVRIFGEDYLGQPMAEDIVVAGGVMKKPFYRIFGARGMPGHTTAVAAVTVARGANLSLPFKGSIEWAKEAGAFIDLAFAKIVPFDPTDPATATTGDPRGQYIPTAAPDGVKEYVISLRPDPSINVNNNGGLHGIRAFNA